MQLETAEVHALGNAAGAQHLWGQWQDPGQPAYASVCSLPFSVTVLARRHLLQRYAAAGGSGLFGPHPAVQQVGAVCGSAAAAELHKVSHGRAAALHYGRAACGIVALWLTCLASCPEYVRLLHWFVSPRRAPSQGARH